MIDEKKLIDEINSLSVMVTGLRARRSVLAEYEKHYKESIIKTINEQPITTPCYLGSPCPYQNEDIKDNIGWIPCHTEQFPSAEDYVLLSFENFNLPIVGRWEEDERGGAFYIGDEDETCIAQGLIVNAWMPLPKPYKGD